MSEAVSALNGAEYEGAVLVQDAGLQGMITLRGDLAGAALGKALHDLCSLAVPAPRRMTSAGTRSALWMSPDELLVLCPYGDAPRRASGLQAALAGEHALVATVSDARAMFTLDGASLREVLAKLAPVDMAPGRIEPGEVRRTRLAQVAAAFWLEREGRARVVCFRSVARYVFDILSDAASPDAAVGVFDGR